MTAPLARVRHIHSLYENFLDEQGYSGFPLDDLVSGKYRFDYLSVFNQMEQT